MPSIMDTSTFIEPFEADTLTIEPPEVGATSPGFWRTLAYRLTHQSAPAAPGCAGPHAYEAPLDRFVREYPSLAVMAFASM